MRKNLPRVTRSGTEFAPRPIRLGASPPPHQTLGVFSVPAQCSLEPAGGEGDRRVCQAWGTLGDSRTLLQTQAAPAKRCPALPE